MNTFAFYAAVNRKHAARLRAGVDPDTRLSGALTVEGRIADALDGIAADLEAGAANPALADVPNLVVPQ